MHYAKVAVTWRKPFIPVHVWNTVRDLHEYDDSEFHTSGYLIHHGEGYSTIASDIRHRGDGQFEMTGLVHIPRSAILAIDELVTMSELRRIQQDMEDGYASDRVETNSQTFADAFEAGASETRYTQDDTEDAGQALAESLALAAKVFKSPRKPRKTAAKAKTKRAPRMAKDLASLPASKPVKATKSRKTRKAKNTQEAYHA